MLDLELNLNIVPDASSVGSQTVRIMVIYDRESNGVAPTFAQLTNGVSTLAPYNRDNLHRFVFFYDKTLTLWPTTATGPTKVIRKHIPVPCQVQYNNLDVIDVTAIVSGSLHLFVCGNVVAGSADSYVSGFAQVTFNDF